MKTPTYTVYTDGTCAPTNPGPCGWGAVLINRESMVATEHCGFIGHGTNQIAEIAAATAGLLLVPAGTVIELVSNSQYVVKGLNEWRTNWERNGWCNADNKPVSNLSHWKQLFAAADARKVSVHWAQGHSSEQYNHRADAMANNSLMRCGY